MAAANRLLIPLLMIFVVLISGCTNQTPQQAAPSFGGADGVVIKFFEGTPPATSGEGDIFDVSLALENMGDHRVLEGEAAVTLRGVNPTNFGYGDEAMKETVSPLLVAQTIEGQVIGGQDVLNWPGLCYAVDLNTDQTVNFVAQSCYRYETKANFDVCFNQDPYAQTTGAETCTVLGEKDARNSVAPIKVVGVTESPAGKQKFRFIVKLSNEGEGEVYSWSELETACTAPTLRQLNVVNIESIKVGATELVTNGVADQSLVESSTWLPDADSGKIYTKLVNGEGQFMFTYAPDFAIPVYTDLIEVTLSYGYTEQAIAPITISAIPEVSGSEVC